jgi:hypothetical protein
MTRVCARLLAGQGARGATVFVGSGLDEGALPLVKLAVCHVLLGS